MKKFVLLILAIILFSCKENSSKKLDNFSLSISDHNFNYDLKSGTLQIPGMNFIGTVKLTSSQNNKIEKAFYKFHIDTLNGEKHITQKKTSVMPDSNILINVKLENLRKSKLNISNQVENNADLSRTESDVFEFKKQLIKVLNENSDFRNCMDTLKSNFKKLPPIL